MSFISVFKKEVVDGFKQSKWLPLITACAVLSAIIGPGLHIPLLHLLFIAIGLFLFFTKKTKIEKSALWLLLYLPINLLITNPDKIFSSWTRLGLFTVVFIFAAPLLTGKYVGIYRKKLLMGILLICVLLGLVSFACYFMGINYMGNVQGDIIYEYKSEVGGFGGVFFQSIILGMVCGMGILYLIYRLENVSKNNRKWFYVAIAILAITVLISSSRSALLATLAGVLIMVFHYGAKHGRAIKILMNIVLVALLTIPIWQGFTEGIEQKMAGGTELGEYGSRTSKWNARITEFASSPVVGIGYASVNPRLDDVGAGGVVEPGSSWLAILSMTGIIGLVLSIIIFVHPISFLKSHPSPYHNLLLGLLAFIATHMFAEGYIFAGGSSLCFIAWLIVGCCCDAKYLS